MKMRGQAIQERRAQNDERRTKAARWEISRSAFPVFVLRSAFIVLRFGYFPISPFNPLALSINSVLILKISSSTDFFEPSSS
jgi:hypothetical protein